MKPLFFLLYLFFIPFVCLSSSDDSLPEGQSSRFLVFPFVIRSPETDWGFGGAGAFLFKANNNEENLRTSDINLLSLYTLKKQTVIVLGSTIFFSGEKKIFRGQASYSYYPDKFWGLGNQSPESAKQDYNLKQIFFNPQFIFEIYKKVFAGASFELQNIKDFTYTSGTIFDLQQISGRQGGLTSGAGILITFDTRNNAYSPSKGSFAELNLTRFSSVLGSDFDFTSYILDLRHFFSIGKGRVLGLHSYNRFNHGNTPIRYLSMLGGSEIMRGYYKGRFADQNLIAFQGELRQYIFWRLGIAAFVSAGQVGASLDNFALNEFHLSGGGGVRIMLHEKEKLNLRIDMGFGKNSTGVYVIMKEAF